MIDALFRGGGEGRGHQEPEAKKPKKEKKAVTEKKDVRGVLLSTIGKMKEQSRRFKELEK